MNRRKEISVKRLTEYLSNKKKKAFRKRQLS